jgi:hypothetical protein
MHVFRLGCNGSRTNNTHRSDQRGLNADRDGISNKLPASTKISVVET